METRTIVLAALVALIALGVLYMMNPTLGGLLRYKNEGFANEMPPMPPVASMDGLEGAPFSSDNELGHNPHIVPHEAQAAAPAPAGGAVAEGFENLSPSPMPFKSAEKNPANCYPKNQLAPQELLPNDANSKWAQVNPMGAGDIAGKNFLNAGSLVGVNTVGQSLRNASWDLRSEPANPQVQVSPWSQSTIEPDLARRPLEMA